MSNDVKPSAEPAQEPGTAPMPPLDGTDPIRSGLSLMIQQAKTMEAMAETIDRLASMNHDLMDRLMGEPEEPDDKDQGLGVDMAGKPIRTS